MAIKRRLYGGRFQLQFSIHTTDGPLRTRLVPVKTWDFARMAEYGRAFLEGDDRRIALNFALAENMPVDPGALLAHFSPQLFLIKITPVNPTHRAALNGIVSHVTPGRETYGAVTDLKKAGYDVILSIGSNCGQFVTRVRNAGAAVEGGYTYPLVPGRHETADGEGPGTASR